MRPYLLLDVDGPLNPHRAAEPPEGYERFHIVEGKKSWDVVLNPSHGQLISSLLDTFDLVWATGWEHGANRLLAPRIGLTQEHQVIVWPEGVLAGAGERGALCWKTPHLRVKLFAADRFEIRRLQLTEHHVYRSGVAVLTYRKA